jgi:hypothetical protein
MAKPQGCKKPLIASTLLVSFEWGFLLGGSVNFLDILWFLMLFRFWLNLKQSLYNVFEFERVQTDRFGRVGHIRILRDDHAERPSMFFRTQHLVVCVANVLNHCGQSSVTQNCAVFITFQRNQSRLIS